MLSYIVQSYNKYMQYKNIRDARYQYLLINAYFNIIGIGPMTKLCPYIKADKLWIISAG